METFQPITSTDPVKEIILSAFDMQVDLSGGWGYTKEDATVIHSTNEIPLEQFQHTLANMRAYIEMNMTLAPERRYGSINPREIKREQVTEAQKHYEKVTYEISGMREELYADFINEYKKGYGQPDFDMSDHFRRRKEATITRTVEHWFDLQTV
jgi:FKBP-type peptidyl-prolyl cis-trans isomerase 2